MTDVPRTQHGPVPRQLSVVEVAPGRWRLELIPVDVGVAEPEAELLVEVMAATRETREDRSMLQAPCCCARSIAAMVRAVPTPWACTWASWSTTTCSIASRTREALSGTWHVRMAQLTVPAFGSGG